MDSGRITDTKNVELPAEVPGFGTLQRRVTISVQFVVF
jgi:hypothetical protein